MIKTDKRKCLRCSACVGVCPHTALTLKEHGIECDKEKCVSCGLCESFCPMGAISMVKE
ncbi:4Fe-4S binding protein [Candidatus Aenigmatarchaeota archaeon]